MARFDSDSSLRVYLKEISKTDLLTREEEVELAAKIAKGDGKARAHMIKANLRLVVKIAQDYSGYGLPLADARSQRCLAVKFRHVCIQGCDIAAMLQDDGIAIAIPHATKNNLAVSGRLDGCAPRCCVVNTYDNEVT